MSSNVEFEGDDMKYTMKSPSSGSAGSGFSGQSSSNDNQPKMVRWLMNNGLAKSPATAQGILIGVIIVNVIITYVLIDYFL
ncbi:MAG: hypothetical protein AAB470_03355 [Patescibacteria group bacterium]